MLALACSALAVALLGLTLALRLLFEVRDIHQLRPLTDAKTIREALTRVEMLSQAVESEVEQQRGRLVKWRTEIESVYEAMEDLSGAIETKRKRIAAAESRRKQAEGGDTEAGNGVGFDGWAAQRMRELNIS